MSDFDTLFEEDTLPQLIDKLGESITYTPTGGSGVARNAIFSEAGTDVVLFQDGPGDRAVATITIHNSATLGVLAPANGDQITRRSEEWFVQSITTTPTAHKLTAARVEHDKHSHAGTEIQR